MKIKLIIYIILILQTYSCTKKVAYSCLKDVKQKAEIYSVTEVAENINDLNDEILLIQGRLSIWPMHGLIIYSEHTQNRLWVNLSKQLVKDDGTKVLLEDLEILDGKMVFVKGKINSIRKGHLGKFEGTIEEICFIGNKLIQ